MYLIADNMICKVGKEKALELAGNLMSDTDLG